MINKIKKGERVKSLKENIKNYFKDMVKRDDWNLILLVLIKDRLETPKMDIYNVKNKGTEYEITIPVSQRAIMRTEKDGLRKYFKGLLLHEITHVLDRIRGGHKGSDSKYWKDKDETSIDTGKYYKDPGEINAIIAELKQYRKENKRRWNNEIVDSGRLFDTMIRLHSPLKKLDKNQRNSFMKKIIKRLYREGLLSKKWTGKIKP